jgi:hypothetical protein
MNIEEGAMNGTAVGKKKRINDMAVRVWRTSGCRVGYDLDHLQEINYREPSVPMGTARPLTDGVIDKIRYNQGWTIESDITIEQSRPCR